MTDPALVVVVVTLVIVGGIFLGTRLLWRWRRSRGRRAVIGAVTEAWLRDHVGGDQ